MLVKLNNRVAILSLTLIMAFRILGLFMILPVFSAHAIEIPGATPILVGIALGVYGITQALLQMPFGFLSDRIGRLPVITIGLLLFAAGSVVCALADNMTLLILGRALQGTGAIGSTILAFVADLTQNESRNQAMAFLGLSIGIAFSAAMILGPLIFAWHQLSGIFWVTTGLAGLGLLLLLRIPKPPVLLPHPDIEPVPGRFKATLQNTQLLRLDFGIFSLHLILTALFIAIPLLFTRVFDLSASQQTATYLIVLLLSFVAMLPLIIIAEKKRQMKTILVTAIALLLVTQILLSLLKTQALLIAALLFLFFTAFNLLEASLPSLVSKFAPIRAKGTAMGMYSTSQYLGIALGGGLGGYLLAQFGIHGIFIFCSVAALLWLLVAMTMQPPPYLSTLTFEANVKDSEITQKLNNLTGVAEISYSPHEALIYMKVDRRKIDENELRKRVEEVTLA